MKIKEVEEILNRIMPPDIAFEWDNVGLLIGDGEAQVKKVLLTLDVTPSAVEKAIKEKCNLIISHHPLIFGKIDRINNPLFLKLIKAGIDVISMHTNLDSIPSGVNKVLAEKLGLSNLSFIIPNDDNLSYGSGMLGDLTSELSLEEFSRLVKTRLEAPFVKLWNAGKGNPKIKRVAVCGGSGSFLIGKASAISDVIVTGDVTYHTMLDSTLPIIDAGHFFTENPVLEYLRKILAENKLDSTMLTAKEHEICNLKIF